MLSRKSRYRIALGLLLLTFFGWLAWPFIASPSQMEGFCTSLAAGTSFVQVKAQAARHDYRITPLMEGRAVIHEPRSFGRYTCSLQFGADGLESSAYSFND
ncbi:MAG: hypothetical protein A3I66_20770 [Burkholderiales bacterium RIFCSPLOWO2_02_FULL_57_36]|nr:MAG: hypothetical protein A3I66_20770 [Burkholderiales bacterium RIFCSPLOWO2_02_FULL_57_36]